MTVNILKINLKHVQLHSVRTYAVFKTQESFARVLGNLRLFPRPNPVYAETKEFVPQPIILYHPIPSSPPHLPSAPGEDSANSFDVDL